MTLQRSPGEKLQIPIIPIERTGTALASISLGFDPPPLFSIPFLPSLCGQVLQHQARRPALQGVAVRGRAILNVEAGTKKREEEQEVRIGRILIARILKYSSVKSKYEHRTTFVLSKGQRCSTFIIDVRLFFSNQTDDILGQLVF